MISILNEQAAEHDILFDLLDTLTIVAGIGFSFCGTLFFLARRMADDMTVQTTKLHKMMH
jgi:hypothetical protein